MCIKKQISVKWPARYPYLTPIEILLIISNYYRYGKYHNIYGNICENPDDKSTSIFGKVINRAQLFDYINHYDHYR